MFDLKDLIKRAFKNIAKDTDSNIKDIEMEMVFTENEPIFNCFVGDKELTNNKGSLVFTLENALGYMKYSMLVGMAGAFGGLSKIVNDKFKESAEKHGFKFEEIKLLFFYNEVEHSEFRVIDKQEQEKYFKFEDFA